MKNTGIDRRKFNTLTAAALGGMVAGTVIGCSGGGEEGGGSGDEGSGGGGDEVAANDWTGDKHVCKGLNACKGKGAGGDNDCAGQGTCATAAAHSCHGENDCKYQGGCEESIGNNACKGKGECGVPFHEKKDTWAKARASFEAAMTKADKNFGDPPAKEAPEGSGDT